MRGKSWETQETVSLQRAGRDEGLRRPAVSLPQPPVLSVSRTQEASASVQSPRQLPHVMVAQAKSTGFAHTHLFQFLRPHCYHILWMVKTENQAKHDVTSRESQHLGDKIQG